MGLRETMSSYCHGSAGTDGSYSLALRLQNEERRRARDAVRARRDQRQPSDSGTMQANSGRKINRILPKSMRHKPQGANQKDCVIM